MRPDRGRLTANLHVQSIIPFLWSSPACCHGCMMKWIKLVALRQFSMNLIALETTRTEDTCLKELSPCRGIEPRLARNWLRYYTLYKVVGGGFHFSSGHSFSMSLVLDKVTDDLSLVNLYTEAGYTLVTSQVQGTYCKLSHFHLYGQLRMFSQPMEVTQRKSSQIPQGSPGVEFQTPNLRTVRQMC